MATKVELQERVSELEHELETIYDTIGDLLDIEGEPDEDE